MKKILVVFLIMAFFVMFSLNAFAERVEYTAKDIDTFINDWTKCLQGEEVKYLSVKPTESSLFVPYIKNENFKIAFIEERDDRYDYYYHHINDTRHQDVHNSGIIVSVKRSENTFASAVKNLHVIEEKAYDTAKNIWYIDYNTKLVTISFAGNVVNTVDELEEYFVFQIVDLSDKVENNNNVENPSPNLPNDNPTLPDPPAEDRVPPVDDAPDAPVDEKSPVWKTPVFIVTSCAAVVAVAALGTLVVVKKKKSN